jgi:3-methylcrotonyl-CoA carboxylase alpha subunit
MTGKVIQVSATPGRSVAENEVLVVLEAMKMEYRLAAPRAGVVAAVHCAVGDLVDLGRTLVTFTDAGEGRP